MFLRTTILMAALVALLSAGSAQAAPISLSFGSGVISPSSVDATGSKQFNASFAQDVNTIIGSMPAYSKLTLTYTIGAVAQGYYSSLSNISTNISNGLYSAKVAVDGVYDDNTGDLTGYSTKTNYTGPVAGVVAASTAGIPTQVSNSVILSNFGAKTASFISSITAYVTTMGTSNIQISYTLSQVPLPAALPLFGAGILALVARRKKNSVAA